MDMIAAVGELLYLGRADVESLLDVDAMLDALADVLVIYSSGAASVPPRTALRTGGTAAVAARVLARDDARVLAILGAGVQGLAHLETFPRIRDFKEIRIASRNADRAKDLAKRSLHARAVESFEDAVRGA